MPSLAKPVSTKSLTGLPTSVQAVKSPVSKLPLLTRFCADAAETAASARNTHALFLLIIRNLSYTNEPQRLDIGRVQDRFPVSDPTKCREELTGVPRNKKKPRYPAFQHLQ